MIAEVTYKKLPKNDWHLIIVSINERINQLKDSRGVYSKTCPATGANSDKELCTFLEAVRTRMSGKPQCHKCAGKDGLRKMNFPFAHEKMFICNDCFNAYEEVKDERVKLDNRKL